MRKKYPKGSHHKVTASGQVVTRALLKRIRALAIDRISATGDVGSLELSVLTLVNMLLKGDDK